ncbi:MAG: BMP family ABC transporter substrate-binding protein [Peptococcaceae bacterium]|nr:BMP family ABC transporter substrate-binding protein [Peptococcaceae bacterium]
MKKSGMKKTIALFMVLLVLMSVLGACGSSAGAPNSTGQSSAGQTGGPAAGGSEDPFKVAIVLALGGLGDGSYNDSVYEGFVRAENELGIPVQVVEPSEVAEMQGHFVELARSGEYGLIFGVGYECEEYVVAAAEQFPDQKFVIMDSTVSDHDNITSVQISGPQMCFLCGAIAGMYSKNNMAGIVMGIASPSMTNRGIVPYTAGARLINPDIEIRVKYSGSWSDSSAGKEIALALNQEGCDVIMSYAGGSGLGAFPAALEKGFYVIGTGGNQNSFAPDLTIASGLFFYGNLAYICIQEAMAGTLQSGLKDAGLAEGGVGYTTDGSNVPMDPANAERLERITQQIIDGSVIVPESESDLDAAIANNANA